MSPSVIRLAKGFSLPLESVTETFAVLARKRAGKSYFARRFAEQLARAGQQLIIVDPKGDHWGIRSSANGKDPGIPIVILGGERGDVPLEAGSGELVAKLAVEERVSLLLDLSLFRKHELATFMAAFLETLYRLKSHERYRTPLMLIIDEADAIAPQKTSARAQGGNVERMLGAANDIVRRGGQRGIGCMLVTQRSAVISKDVLTQCEVLVALRTIAPQDLAALMAWVDVHGTQEGRATLKASLPSLPIGDAWMWSPGWPTEEGIFQRIHTLPIETFDSGATPKPGQRRVEPKSLADVDLEALRTHMAETIARAKADDPRELKKRITELERDLTAMKNMAPAHKEVRVEVPVLHQLALERALDVSESVVKLLDETREVHSRVDRLVEMIRKVPSPRPYPAKSLGPLVRPNAIANLAAREASLAPSDHKPANGAELCKGERAILIAMAQHEGGVTCEQLAVLTGYKRTSRNVYLRRLRAAGLAEVSGDRILATNAGIIWLGDDYDPLPTGDALRLHWLTELPEGERRLLEILIKAWPEPLHLDDLDEAGYRRTSRNVYLRRLRARELATSVGRGQVRASNMLFN